MISPNNHKYFSNMVANLPRSLGDCHVGQCKDMLKDLPAVIIAAGPSLNYSLRVCRKALKRAYTFCVDSALTVCLKEIGLDPDFVVSCDGSKSVTKYLAPMRLDKTVLIACASGYPQLFEIGDVSTGCKISRIIVGQEGTPFSKLYALTGRTQLKYWGSVSSMALATAHYMGCDPIIFIGQDFSFRTLYSHAVGSPAGYEVDPTDDKLRSEFDTDGRPVLTTVFLRAFRDFMNTQAAAISGITMVNASSGIFSGIKERWTAEKLAHWLNEYGYSGRCSLPESDWTQEKQTALNMAVLDFKQHALQHEDCLKGIAQSDADMLTQSNGRTLFRITDEHRRVLSEGLDRLYETLQNEEKQVGSGNSIQAVV